MLLRLVHVTAVVAVPSVLCLRTAELSRCRIFPGGAHGVYFRIGSPCTRNDIFIVAIV